MDVEIGNIYWLSITYPSTNETVTRPVVVYAFDKGNPLIASFANITTSQIDDFEGKYDKWKVPIFKWRESGLFEMSYVKANNIAMVDKKSFNYNKFIGKMNKSDLKNTVKKVQEFINSDEEYW